MFIQLLLCSGGVEEPPTLFSFQTPLDLLEIPSLHPARLKPSSRHECAERERERELGIAFTLPSCSFCTDAYDLGMGA